MDDKETKKTYEQSDGFLKDRFAKSIRDFRDSMYYRLCQNIDKGVWDDDSLNALQGMLLHNVGELLELVNVGRIKAEIPNTKRTIRQQAADVANLAMMIAENYE